MTSTFSWPAGKRAALSLSFDDARLTQADQGLPILNAHGVKATFYVSFHLMEQRLDAWREAVRQGHEIGNHSLNHPCSGNYNWSRNYALEDYTLERMETELEDANRRIQELLGVEPQTFAYPCGQKFVGRGEEVRSYVPLVARRFTAGRGFRETGINDPAFCDLAQLFGTDGDVQQADAVMQLLEDTLNSGGWLILAAHEVAEAPRMGMAPQVLEALCRRARQEENRLWTAPVADIARHVQAARGG